MLEINLQFNLITIEDETLSNWLCIIRETIDLKKVEVVLYYQQGGLKQRVIVTHNSAILSVAGDTNEYTDIAEAEIYFFKFIRELCASAIRYYESHRPLNEIQNDNYYQARSIWVDIKKPITKNAAKCLLCGDIIESRSVHEKTSCSCGNLSVDGGLKYHRVQFYMGFNTYENQCEYEEFSYEKD